MSIAIGVVGAGNRGRAHTTAFKDVEDATVTAVADIDEEAAASLAEDYDVPGTYDDYRDMLADEDLDALSVCVHNNLHRPITVDAAEAGCHVFCEKPIAATYEDGERMAEACEDAGVRLGVQNYELFSEETRAARRLIDDGRLGEMYYGRAVRSRRRGRPYVDGYATPGFVTTEVAGGGPVIDIGTYAIGQLLYLLGNAPVERVNGATFEFTEDAYASELVGDDRDIYLDRLQDHDVEDAGMGFARLADGSLLSIRAAWHMFLPDRSSVVAGSKGGLDLDSGELYTTCTDYEATVELDIGGYESRQGLLESESGYDRERDLDQFNHWIDTLTGVEEDPIPTGNIALNSMRVMEGIYLSQEADRELTAEKVSERSSSTAVEP